MKTIFRSFFYLFILFHFSIAQDTDSTIIRSFFSQALSDDFALENLKFFAKETKGRLPASSQALKAIHFVQNIFEKMKLDSVYLQEVMVPDWRPGDAEYAAIHSKKLGEKKLNICPLGYAVGTGKNGITGRVVEIHHFDQLHDMGETLIQDRIVFFNRSMDRSVLNTMAAYSMAANQRVYGAIEASKLKAKGVIVRSLTTRLDDFPHTGVLRYKEDIKKIPAIAVSTNDAEILSSWLKEDPELSCKIITRCTTFPDKQSYNVIGEIKGNEYPDEIIVVGAHLDAWFNTEGAHDDAAGCVHVMEVVRLFKSLGINPKRTIRAVLFIDEEIMQTGARKYAEMVKLNEEKQLAAIESDRGGFAPKGFTIDASEEIFTKIVALQKYFIPYDIFKFVKGHSGVDIDPLKEFNVPLIGFLPECQRYFDYHHSENDTFGQVNFRELQMGSAAIASLVYLIDQYGL
jgi:carboxypeptidase Q